MSRSNNTYTWKKKHLILESITYYEKINISQTSLQGWENQYNFHLLNPRDSLSCHQRIQKEGVTPTANTN